MPLESVIRERQEESYAVLRSCDQTGKSTAFVEFTLRDTDEALQRTLSEFAPSPVTPSQRLEAAAEHFQSQRFSRKGYLALFPGLSTASASQDLRKGVDDGWLNRSGEQTQAFYLFASE